MNEVEWRRTTDLPAMWTALGAALSIRKFRLFAGQVAVALLARPLPRYGETAYEELASLHSPKPLGLSADAAETLIRFADGEVSAKRVRRFIELLRRHYPDYSLPVQIVRMLAETVVEKRPDRSVVSHWLNPRAIPIAPAIPANIIRDLFADPCHPVAFDPRWLTADVVGLARGIYDERAFDRLPILADALMDAGCDDEHVVAHCRSDGPHVRGCWVVDAVLGKE